MIVKEIQPAPHVGWSLVGETLTVGPLSIDLAAEEKDSQVIIDISREGDGLTRGMGDGYVASVLIPPRCYEAEETDEGELVLVPAQINTDAVELMLWQYDDQPQTTEGNDIKDEEDN
ncbi:hypothetical protein [Dethiosulfovibrio salsuginis]|uniref:Uncharacterized protein n=1 Tax=Dethiosulfovibrio salsuginis TaxID=561720 RepID=A0A1X7L1H9_9BACT|nr:hypothetical protein [Dethiosulfovibrio salsuginis]SMG47698.1 hypothetical protein SAMN06275492_14221 [Dethiosulfovibrio salsuginis]